MGVHEFFHELCSSVGTSMSPDDRRAGAAGRVRKAFQFYRIPNQWKDCNSWTLLVGVLGLWAFARALVPALGGAYLPGYWLPSCPLRTLTGIPCPFCGITTGSAWLARGNISESWRSNILSPILMLGATFLAGYALLFRLIGCRAIALRLSARLRVSAWIVAASLVVASWVANLIRK